MGSISDLETVLNDPSTMMDIGTERLWSIDYAEVEEFQLSTIARRFSELRNRLGILNNLADDIGITEISGVGDITALCFPHTTYKSYTEKFIENKEFGKLTNWLSAFTTHDLKSADTRGCKSMEEWISVLERDTPIRPMCSSGTSGKISFFPKSTDEQLFSHYGYMFGNSGFRDEDDSGLQTGEVDFFCPWPVASGHHNLPTAFRILRDFHYAARPGKHVYTVGDGHWDLDMHWLSAKLQAAANRGETLQLDAKQANLRERLREVRERELQNKEAEWDAFLNELVVGHAGQRVFVMAAAPQLYSIALEAEKRDLTVTLTPDSYIQAGGGSGLRGTAFPNDWMDVVRRRIPHRINEVYGMSEINAVARLCSHGQFHFPPWVFMSVLDPDTGVPLAREGEVTGRLALFDLLPQTYWGGCISGDRVTVQFSSECGCGRKGARMSPEIARYSSLKDDDKITCAVSAGAYERATDLTLTA